MTGRSAHAAKVAPHDAGTVLVAVLWLLGVLGALTIAMATFTTNTLSAVTLYSDKAAVQAELTAGVELAVLELLGAKVPLQGTSSATTGDGKVGFEFHNEAARIDVNAASQELLAGLFVALGARDNEASTYAENIVRRRDPAPPDPSGAVSASARRPFFDIAQLSLVPNIPSDILGRAKPFLTVYSGLPAINAHIAAPEVLAALPGMTRERVRTLLALRAREYPDQQAWADGLGTAAKFTTDGGSKSTRIDVKAQLADGYTAGSEVVVSRFDDDTEPYRVMSWEDDVPLFSPSAGPQIRALRR